MWSALQWIKGHLAFLLPAAMAAGVLFGVTAESVAWLKEVILPLTIFMVLPMMIMFPMRQLFTNGVSLRLLSVNILINFFLFPLLVFGIGRLFFSEEPGFMLGIFMLGLIPTSGMTISWTGFARGNIKAAVSLTVLGLIIGALLAPLYLSLMMGESLLIPSGTIFRQILLVVFIPMVAGNLIRLLLIRLQGKERFAGYWKQRIPTLSSLGVLLIVFAAIAMKAEMLVRNPSLIIIAIIPVLLFYLTGFTLTTMIARITCSRSGAGDGPTLVFSTVIRNLSIALAIAVTAFPELGSSAALILAVAFAVQVQSASLYVRFSERMIGCPARQPAA